jgi:hypothetical protein
VEGEADAYSTTPTHTVRRDSPARETKWSALWLQGNAYSHVTEKNAENMVQNPCTGH